MDKLIIATRGSQLAMWQAEYVKGELEKRFPDMTIEFSVITATGDKILDKPLALIGGKGLFTKEIEEVMLAGDAHLAVHSLKDVPTELPEGLRLAAITKRDDIRDVFLSHKYENIEALPEGAVVGTTSLRRQMQLRAIRPDLTIKNLRGNVNTRLRKLADGEYDAIILAYVGMKRLGLLESVPFHDPISDEVMIPPSGQASLGIEIVDDPEVAKIAETLNDPDSALAAKIERDFVARLEGSCQVPIAVNAKVYEERVLVRAMVGLPDGTEILQERIEAPKEKAENLGRELADDMVAQGAKELLARAESMAFKEERCERF
ncbi:hydroxymethylbilane synthase [Hydrogenimonas cancrithermarum]|uniref:Porphobilinogen deaminase n=1 Tax=Hydrogenimonas cancrithermarum TaxID=2993563 RepID=A0ABM8FL31_9BACT|nr:hydroxymethylbilane synthase [Hydrogenimonas cancrithermarum]BDY12098.1 porphobilinogen deaminase [Hydrogenimonas cancrithermarum]